MRAEKAVKKTAVSEPKVTSDKGSSEPVSTDDIKLEEKETKKD